MEIIICDIMSIVGWSPDGWSVGNWERKNTYLASLLSNIAHSGCSSCDNKLPHKDSILAFMIIKDKTDESGSAKFQLAAKVQKRKVS